MTNAQPAEAEDLPGYDGPTLDAADRLSMWMDKSVPAADRDRLIAEHRDQVLGEGAELILQHRGGLDNDSPWWDTRDRDNAANLLLAARATTTATTQEGLR